MLLCVITNHWSYVQCSQSMLCHAIPKVARWHNGYPGNTPDLQSKGCEFDSRSGHYRVVDTRMGDYLQTGKPF